ncbi:hypothetical protein Ddc_06346 [Ditylenchus destructor]|nr:hypothetical protein Ddc_06346 [Ditylenchus destructor]
MNRMGGVSRVTKGKRKRLAKQVCLWAIDFLSVRPVTIYAAEGFRESTDTPPLHPQTHKTINVFSVEQASPHVLWTQMRKGQSYFIHHIYRH